MFLPCREIPVTDADRNWVRRQFTQLALEQHLTDGAYAHFSDAVHRATWRSELQYLADRLTASPCPPSLSPGQYFPVAPV